jgi:hypothetical protein
MEYRVRFVPLAATPEELQETLESVCNSIGVKGFRLVHTEPGLVGATNGIFLFFERP